MYCNFYCLYIISIIPYQNIVFKTNNTAIINNKKKSSVGVILINVGGDIDDGDFAVGRFHQVPTSIWGIIYPLFKYDFDIKIWYFV